MIEFYVFFVSLQQKQDMEKTNSSSNYRIELRTRIREVAMQHFLAKGIRAVKMDDIANTLSISKRTLYELYNNKEDLLLEVLKVSDETRRHRMSTFAEKVNNNVMEIIFEVYRMHAEAYGNVNPLFYQEMKKYSKVTNYLQEKDSADEELTQAFFNLGIEQGYFRQEIDFAIVSKMMRECVRYVIHNTELTTVEYDYIFTNVIFLFFRGFCTQKGIEAVNRMFDKDNSQG